MWQYWAKVGISSNAYSVCMIEWMTRQNTCYFFIENHILNPNLILLSFPTCLSLKTPFGKRMIDLEKLCLTQKSFDWLCKIRSAKHCNSILSFFHSTASLYACDRHEGGCPGPKNERWYAWLTQHFSGRVWSWYVTLFHRCVQGQCVDAVYMFYGRWNKRQLTFGRRLEQIDLSIVSQLESEVWSLTDLIGTWDPVIVQ